MISLIDFPTSCWISFICLPCSKIAQRNFKRSVVVQDSSLRWPRKFFEITITKLGFNKHFYIDLQIERPHLCKTSGLVRQICHAVRMKDSNHQCHQHIHAPFGGMKLALEKKSSDFFASILG